MNLAKSGGLIISVEMRVNPPYVISSDSRKQSRHLIHWPDFGGSVLHRVNKNVPYYVQLKWQPSCYPLEYTQCMPGWSMLRWMVERNCDKIREKSTRKHMVYRFNNTWKSQVRLKMVIRTLSFSYQKMGALIKKSNINPKTKSILFWNIRW